MSTSKFFLRIVLILAILFVAVSPAFAAPKSPPPGQAKKDTTPSPVVVVNIDNSEQPNTNVPASNSPANSNPNNNAPTNTQQGGPPDKVVICHKEDGNGTVYQTMDVPPSAVAAHLGHGDTLGPCQDAPPPPAPQLCVETITVYGEWTPWQTDPNNPTREVHSRTVTLVDKNNRDHVCATLDPQVEYRDKPRITPTPGTPPEKTPPPQSTPTITPTLTFTPTTPFTPTIPVTQYFLKLYGNATCDGTWTAWEEHSPAGADVEFYPDDHGVINSGETITVTAVAVWGKQFSASAQIILTAMCDPIEVPVEVPTILTEVADQCKTDCCSELRAEYEQRIAQLENGSKQVGLLGLHGLDSAALPWILLFGVLAAVAGYFGNERRHREHTADEHKRHDELNARFDALEARLSRSRKTTPPAPTTE